MHASHSGDSAERIALDQGSYDRFRSSVLSLFMQAVCLSGQAKASIIFEKMARRKCHILGVYLGA